MKEAYVSYEVAKLLKEKGFAWRVFNFYDEHGGFSEHIGSVYSLYNWNYPTKDEYGSQYCSAPTQQMAMRWFREEKMIFISPFPTFKSSPTFKSRLPYSWRVDIKNCFGEELGGNYEYITYEDAVEAALEYCLTNLI